MMEGRSTTPPSYHEFGVRDPNISASQCEEVLISQPRREGETNFALEMQRPVPLAVAGEVPLRLFVAPVGREPTPPPKYEDSKFG